jgi:hypothetical protein
MKDVRQWVSPNGHEWETTIELDDPFIRTTACHIETGECLSYEIDYQVPLEMRERAMKDFIRMMAAHPLGGWSKEVPLP